MISGVFNIVKKNNNILCFMVPAICPLCGDDVLTTPSRIPPYIIPCPLVNAKNHPCSVIIKPTIGTFLQNYTNQSDLHVGVTDSSGCTYDFNENGINIGLSWQQCVVIQMLNDDYNLKSRWDSVLKQISRSPAWHQTRYDEQRHNCFDFVLTFLQSCDLQRSMPAIQNKHTFCQEIIIKQTHKAAVYISLYRKIQQNGFLIQPAKAQQLSGLA